MNTLTLIRGLPGSGKSTLAKKLKSVATAITEHFEADQFFIVDGVYTFDATKLGQAHFWCMRETDDALFYKKDVIVSNTFTKLKEMRPYFEIAQKNGASVNVILCQNSFGSIHDVPQETLDAMKARFTYDISDLFTKADDAQEA